MAFLPTFPDRPTDTSTSSGSTAGGRSGYGYSARYQNGILVSVQGTNASNAVTYSIGKVNNTITISSAKFNELITNISSERLRRNTFPFAYTLTNPIDAGTFNNIKNALSVSGFGGGSAYMGDWVGTNSGEGRYQTGTTPELDVYGRPTGVLLPVYAALPDPGIVTYPAAAEPSVPANVAATSLISASTINSLIDSIVAAGQVCTCNCNYCTCNCNYCTCNCNYACTCNCNYSDNRLKKNINLLEVKNGLNVYSFNYLWDEKTTYIGVMAQELVDTVYESALSKDKNDYFMVDYSLLPIKMTRD